MIQVYKKNDLFVIENTITETIYPNLTREETVELLKKFDRDEPEDRCDFAIKEDNISFEYASLDDKDRKIADLEAKLAESERKLEEYKKCNCKECMTDYEKNLNQIIDKFLNENIKLKQQLAEKEKEIEKLNACVVFYKSYSVSFQEKVIDELEKVKRYIDDNAYYVEEDNFGIEINEYIDTQINELKGKVE